MIGQTVSHYKILEELGGGGMGIVYKAEDTKLKRTVALKFLPPELTRDQDAKKRFTHEARAASALQHHNICTIHEIDETADGRVFISMDCYEGETLKDQIAKGPLAVDEAIDIVSQVAEGLAKAHDAGMVHRDIKPANIIITSDGVVKIVDFGLAKLTGQTKVTKTGMTVGTVAYMSPEQARGEELDVRTDIWSLGVIFYEMITGVPPFKSEHEMAVVYSILNETPSSPRSLRKDLPPVLDRMILRALCKDKEQRFTTVDEIKNDLTKYTKERIVDRGPPTGFRQLQVILGRRGVVMLALTLLFTLAFITVRLFDRRGKVRWAYDVALPEIERLTDRGEYETAYELTSRVERVIPDNPALSDLWPRISTYLTIHSNPSGADVYGKPYATPKDPWEHLGKTPLDSTRTPRKLLRLKITKNGFQDINVALTSVFEFRLDEKGTVPGNMVRVPGGTIRVRLGGVTHLEKETVGDFLMDAFEVTNKSYKRFVESGGYRDPEFWKQPFVKDGLVLSWKQAMAMFTDKTGRPGPATWEAGNYLDGEGDHPVTGVSWYEAAAYAEFSGKKLPTIFHWSLAAGTPWASEIAPLSNYNGRGPAPVGRHQGMGPYGNFDMAGNVREWCSNETVEKSRFILGGGWNDPLYSFSDAYAQPPFDRSATNGFRCIRDLVVNANADTLERFIEVARFDPGSVTPISDETFKVFCRMYNYDEMELHATVESIGVDHDDWTREVVSFDAAYAGERVIAHIFLPKKVAPPFQAVILFPGTYALELRSSDELAKLWRGYIKFLVESGRAFIFPIYKSTFERGDGLTVNDLDVSRGSNFYKDHVIMWVKDLKRTIDYLESRTDIDSEKIAYFGSSWGGPMGPIMMAVERRLKTGVLVVAGLGPLRSLPEVDIVNYLPRVKTPVLMLNGRYDYFFPLETAQKPMFELFGTPPEHKRLVISDRGHSFPRARLIEETLNWLDRYLGPVAADGEPFSR